MRTLPLSVSGIILGSGLAYVHSDFQLAIFLLALTTTLFLQILSNLANDYGDFVSGKDNEKRIGPRRTMQSGKLTKKEMLRMIAVFIVLSLLSGVLLIYLGTLKLNQLALIMYLALGISAIVAALKYTMGKKPYGYRGLGDVFVFLFFGIVSTCGTYFLHDNHFSWDLLLPASMLGFLSVAVLNLNNLRDYESDKQNKKNTLVVYMGVKNAKIYHVFLILLPYVLGIVYLFLNKASFYAYAFLVSALVLLPHLVRVIKNKQAKDIDPELKKVALTTFLICILFVGGLILSNKF